MDHMLATVSLVISEAGRRGRHVLTSMSVQFNSTVCAGTAPVVQTLMARFIVHVFCSSTTAFPSSEELRICSRCIKSF